MDWHKYRVGSINVNAYKRKDGTAVRQHQRKGLLSKLTEKKVSSPDSLLTLNGEEEKPLNELVPNMKDIQWAAFFTNDHGLFEKIVAFRDRTGYSLKLITGCVGAILGGVGAIAASAVGAPILLLGALGVAGAGLVGATAVESVALPAARKKEFDHFLLAKTGTNGKITEEQLDEFCRQYEHRKTFDSDTKVYKRGSTTCEVGATGWGKVTWKEKRSKYQADNMKYEINAYFIPEVNHSFSEFVKPVVLPGVNLEGANLMRTTFQECNFDDANFRKGNMKGVEMIGTAKGANFEGANLRGAHLVECDISGANFEGADLQGAWLPPNLDNVNLSRKQIDALFQNASGHYTYTQKSFEETVADLGITNSQFEFMVTSGVIQVRDNTTRKKVDRNFDPTLHHVPIWEIRNAKKVLEENQ